MQIFYYKLRQSEGVYWGEGICTEAKVSVMRRRRGLTPTCRGSPPSHELPCSLPSQQLTQWFEQRWVLCSVVPESQWDQCSRWDPCQKVWGDLVYRTLHSTSHNPHSAPVRGGCNVWREGQCGREELLVLFIIRLLFLNLLEARTYVI